MVRKIERMLSHLAVLGFGNFILIPVARYFHTSPSTVIGDRSIHHRAPCPNYFLADRTVARLLSSDFRSLIGDHYAHTPTPDRLHGRLSSGGYSPIDFSD
jgi:hypothetical protein